MVNLVFIIFKLTYIHFYIHSNLFVTHVFQLFLYVPNQQLIYLADRFVHQNFLRILIYNLNIPEKEIKNIIELLLINKLPIKNT